MDASSRLTPLLDQLIALFNRRSEDLPDGFFDRRTQFLLNGVPFEAMLGRSATDPLVLMLTRGPAGYRFTVKAVWHAVPDARVERGEVAESDGTAARCQCWLSGHLRGTGESTETMFDVALALTQTGIVERASIAVEEGRLARIQEARLRP
jgi:hypothetical protein